MRKTFSIILMLFTVNALVANAQDVPGANIILNPSFDTDDAGWGHYFDYFWDPTNPLAAKASLSVEPKEGFTGNVYKVSIVDAGTASYSVQISYPMALEAGKKYSFKFKASADAARTISLDLQQNVAPNTNWWESDPINLTTTPTVLGPYYFTATMTDPSNLFKFYLGGGGTANGISAYFDDVEVAEIIPGTGVSLPDAPTNVVAVPGSSKAIVSFTPPANTGGLNIKSYTVISSPEGIKATGTSSPIKVAGLTNGTAYTFTVVATNALGNSVASAPSNAVTPVFAPTVYYVSPSGNDNNDGLSVNAPFATLTKAHASAIPADTIYVRTGTYPPFTIRNSGSSSGIITYKAYPGDKPVITCGPSGDWNLLQISASYITVDGIEVKGINDQLTLAQGEANYDKILAAMDAGTSPDYQSTTNTNTNGVSIGEAKIGVVHHVTVKNCKIHDCSAGGAGATNADYLVLENNEIFNNCWYTMWAPSGISVIHLTGTDEGSNIVIRGNRVYNNYTAVKWISIKAYSDGNGIIIDVNDASDAAFPAYTGKFLIENNVVYDNGGRGLYIISSQNAIFRNNTSYWNSKKSFSNGGEMVVYASKDITFVNNIGWANPAYSSENYGIRDDGAWGSNSNIIWKNNLAFNGTVGQPATFLAKTTTTSIDNTNKLGVNPLFVNPTIVPASADFKLQPTSPAINGGTSAYGLSTYDLAYAPRVQGGMVDMGAFEFASVITSDSGDGLKGEYFNNHSLKGTPAIVRVDATVNFDWGSGSYSTGQPADNFSVRWTGKVLPRYTGNYTFEVETDDGVRLWVNNVRIINKWMDNKKGTTKHKGKISLKAGTQYSIRMEYFEKKGNAVAKLRWSSAKQVCEIIPQSHLYSTPATTALARLDNDDKEQREAFLLYPNPTSGRCRIEFVNEGTDHVIIFNSSGNPIMNLKRFGNIEESIDLSGHPRGLYFARIITSTGIRTKKIVLGDY